MDHLCDTILSKMELCFWTLTRTKGGRTVRSHCYRTFYIGRNGFRSIVTAHFVVKTRSSVASTKRRGSQNKYEKRNAMTHLTAPVKERKKTHFLLSLLLRPDRAGWCSGYFSFVRSGNSTDAAAIFRQFSLIITSSRKMNSIQSNLTITVAPSIDGNIVESARAYQVTGCQRSFCSLRVTI